MILPDVNGLVHAFQADSPHHSGWSSWLQNVLAGSDELALADHCVIGILRVTTNPRILETPASTAGVMEFVNSVRAGRRVRPVHATPETWRLLGELIDDDPAIRGNLVPDAYLAALAISHGCRLATADRGFARFDGLDWFNPTRS